MHHQGKGAGGKRACGSPGVQYTSEWIFKPGRIALVARAKGARARFDNTIFDVHAEPMKRGSVPRPPHMRHELRFHVQHVASGITYHRIALTGQELVVLAALSQLCRPQAVHVPLPRHIRHNHPQTIARPVAIHKLNGICPCAVPGLGGLGGKAACSVQ